MKEIKKFTEQPSYINEFSTALLDGFYLKEGETFNDALARASEAFCYGDYDLAQRIYEAAHKGWFMFASPILSNAPRGKWVARTVGDSLVAWSDKFIWEGEKTSAMPISCFALEVPDSIKGQMEANAELAALSVAGGGVGLHNGIRATTDKAPGPIPYMKTMDAIIGYYKQGKCYTGDTELLTEFGWVKFEDLPENVKVAVVGDDGLISFELPKELVKEHHSGKMIQFKNHNRGISFHTTDDHSMVIQRKSRKHGWKPELEKIRADKVPQHNEARFLTGSLYSGEVGTLTALERLKIAFQADGTNANGAWGKGGITFHIKKERKIKRLDSILDELGVDYKKAKTRADTVQYYIKHEHLDKDLDWIDLTAVDGAKARAFLQEISEWDGYRNRSFSFNYVTTVESCADKVQALAFIAGQSSRKRLVEKEGNRKLQFHVFVSSKPFFNLEDLEKHEYQFEGDVYCAVVSTGKIVIRNGEVAMICGNTRRGACAYYMDVSHPDIMEHIKFRIPSGGDSARKADNRVQFHHAVNITDKFTEAVLKDEDFELICPHSKEVKEVVKARHLWEEILEARALTGEPYLFKIDCANRALPQSQKDKGLKIQGSNICIEVTLPTNEERTFVCCLSSLNLAKFDEWKDTTLVADLTRFLDNVLQYFIDNASEELDKAVFSACAERAIGIGTLGWHYYLQSKGIPMEGGGFNSAIQHTHVIYKKIKEQAVEESKKLAVERGEPSDMKGTGLRNSALMAIAPNSNNAVILGESPSIEPISGNAYSHSTRAGTFLVKNPHLEKLLKQYASNLGIDAEKVDGWLEDQWKAIQKDNGSVQRLEYMSNEDKLLFKVGPEIDQHWIIEQSDARAQYVCQSQSLNTFFPAGCDRTYFNSVHLKFLVAPYSKSMYYARMERGINADVAKEIERKAIKDWTPEQGEDCQACSG